MTDTAAVDAAAPVAAPAPPPAPSRVKTAPTQPAPPVAAPTAAAISLEQEGAPLLGADVPAEEPAVPLAAPGWTGEKAAGAVCGIVNIAGLPPYALALRRMDLYRDHWVITDPGKACAGWSDSMARVADALGIPAPGGEGLGLGSDVILAIQGLAQLLVPRVHALAVDTRTVRAERAEAQGLQDNRPAPAPPGAVQSVPDQAPTAAAESSRFRFRPEDVRVLPTPDADALVAMGIS